MQEGVRPPPGELLLRAQRLGRLDAEAELQVEQGDAGAYGHGCQLGPGCAGCARVNGVPDVVVHAASPVSQGASPRMSLRRRHLCPFSIHPARRGSFRL